MIYVYIYIKLFFQEKDPFWEPADTELLIGTVHVYLMSLSYLIDIAENLTITDFKGNSQGGHNGSMLKSVSFS